MSQNQTVFALSVLHHARFEGLSGESRHQTLELRPECLDEQRKWQSSMDLALGQDCQALPETQQGNRSSLNLYWKKRSHLCVSKTVSIESFNLNRIKPIESYPNVVKLKSTEWQSKRQWLIVKLFHWIDGRQVIFLFVRIQQIDSCIISDIVFHARRWVSQVLVITLWMHYRVCILPRVNILSFSI